MSPGGRRTRWLAAAPIGAAALLALSLLRGEGVLPAAAVDHPLAAAACLALGISLARQTAARSVLRHAVYESSPAVYHLALFVAAATGSAVVSIVVFGSLPRLDDDVAALFQARIFATGRITLPLPPHAEFFEQFGVLGARAGLGHWCGMYPPGWPALLALGVLAGAPWLVNPLLGGALVVAIAALGREVYGDRTGRIAGALALASPITILLSASHLSHTATALALAVCLWALCRLLRTRASGYGALAGLAFGLGFLCRPVSALVGGGVFAAWALVRWRESLPAWRGVAAALVIALASFGTLLAFQHRTTGDLRVAGHQAAMGSWGRFGFEELGVHHRHTPARAVELCLLRLRILNERLLGWPVPSLLLALFPFFAARARADDLWMLAPTLGLLGTYALFWYYETEFPGRYLFCALPALFVLGGRGWSCAREVASTPGLRTLFVGFGLGSVIFSGAVATPSLLREYRPNFGDVEDVLPRVVEDYGIRHAVVFMDVVGESDERGSLRNDLYATGFLRNRLDLQGEVVYARNLRRHNSVLMRHYPDRDHYLYRFHRRTGRALLYRLVADGEEVSVVEVPATTADLLGYDEAPPALPVPTRSPERRRLVTQPPYERVR